MFELFLLVTAVLFVLLAALLTYNFFSGDPVPIDAEINEKRRIRRQQG